MTLKKIKCELYNDNFQNFKRYNIPKAQMVIADIPYNIGANAYGSSPEWYIGGDRKNGESKKAGKAFFNTDVNFNIAESNWLHCRVCGNTPMYGIKGSNVAHHWTPPCHTGDILYIPQTWKCVGIFGELGYEVEFRDGQRVKFKFESRERAKKWAKYRDKPACHWQSPYFMPREAARLFLRVTDVWVERLQEMTDDDFVCDFGVCREAIQAVGRDALAIPFWDSTIKKSADRALYGWAANPWVWVISFERCEKPETEPPDGDASDG